MSKEEQTIQALRNAAHDQDDEERSPWEKLAAGELSKEEEAALRAEAEQSEEGRTMLELYRPFDASEEQQLFESLRKRMREEEDARKQREARRRARQRTITIGSFAAAAACATLAVVYPRAPMQRVEVKETGSLGPVADARADRLEAPDAPFRLTFAPTHPIDQPLTVRGALLVHDGRSTRWDVHPNPQAPDNKVRILGIKKDLFPCLEGEWRVIVAIGVASATPSESDMLRLADQGSAGSYQVLSKRVWLDGPPVGSDGKPCPR